MSALQTYSETFRVQLNGVDITTGNGVVYSVVAGSEVGCDVSIDPATGVYTIVNIVSDNASATFKAVYGSQEVLRTWSAHKSRAVAGAAAKLIKLVADRQQISLDALGSPSPATQNNTFTVSKQSTSQTVNWRVYRIDAPTTPLTPVTSYLSAATGDSVTMSVTQFNNARGSAEGVIVEAYLTDGTVALSDRTSVIRVQAGAPGSNAKTLYVASKFQVVTFGSDGQPNPAVQTNDFTINAQNLSTQTYTIGIIRSDGVPVNLVASNLGAGAGGTLTANSGVLTLSGTNKFTMTVEQYNALRAGASGLYINVSHADGPADQISVTGSVDGAPAKSIKLVSKFQNITLDQNGNPNGGQDNEFNILASSLSSGSYVIAITTLTGVTVSLSTSDITAGPGGSLVDNGDTLTLTGTTKFTITSARFNALRGATKGIFVNVSHADGAYDVQGVTAVDAAPAAKSLGISSKFQVVTFGSDGEPNPAVQTNEFTINAQNLNSTLPFQISILRSDGWPLTLTTNDMTAGAGGTLTATSGVLYLSGTNKFTMTVEQYNYLRNLTSGIYITVTHPDGPVDQISVTGSVDGAPAKSLKLTEKFNNILLGTDGLPKPANQDNEYTIQAQSLSSNSFEIKVTDLLGNDVALATTDIIAGAGGTVTDNGVTLQLSGTTKFTIPTTRFTALRGSTRGIFVFVSHYDGPYDVVGCAVIDAAVPAKSITLSSKFQVVTLNAAGSPNPATQTNDFTINPQSLSTQTYTVSAIRSDGVPVALVASNITAGAGGSVSANSGVLTLSGTDTFSMTVTQYNTVRASASGVYFTVSHADGPADTISVTVTSDGQTGSAGKSMQVYADRPVLTYSSDTQLNPTSQPILIQMQANGLSGSSFNISGTNGSGAAINLSTGYLGGAFLTANTGTLSSNGTGLIYSQSNANATQIAMTADQFNTARGSTNSVVLSFSIGSPDNLSYKLVLSRTVNGVTGDSVDIVFVRSASQPAIPTSSAGTPTSPITWYDTPALANSAQGTTNPMWSSVGTKAGGASNFTWTTPTRVEGESITEVTVYARGTTQPSTPSGGSYNISTKVLTAPGGWSASPVSGSGPLWMSKGVASGAPGATSASITWGSVGKIAEDGASGSGNLIFNNEFRFNNNDTYGWEAGSNGTYGSTPTREGGAVSGFSGALNVGSVLISGATSSGQTTDGWRSTGGWPSNFIDRLRLFGTEVNAGTDRFYVSMAQACTNCEGSPVVIYYDANGIQIGETTPQYSTGTVNGGSGGLPANFTRNGYFFDVPSTVGGFVPVYIAMTARMRTTGASNPRLVFTQMFLSRVPAGATNVPPYGYGPTAEPGSDVTTAITGPTDVFLQYDFNGTTVLTGQTGATYTSARVYPFRLYRGQTDISELATWTAETIYGFGTANVSTTAGSRGNTTFGAMNRLESLIKIKASVGGITRTRDVLVRKQMNTVPAGSIQSGTNTFAGPKVPITSTNSAAPTIISDELEVRTGGTFSSSMLTAYTTLGYAGYIVAGTPRAQTILVKAQWAASGSSTWTDFVLDSIVGNDYESFFYDGNLVQSFGCSFYRGIAGQAQGINTNGAYKVRFVGYITGGTQGAPALLWGGLIARGDGV